MSESYNIYCISNLDNFKNNEKTYFKNFLPKNLDLKNKQWEIGIVKFGFQVNTKKINDLSLVSILTDVVIDSPNGDKYSTLIYDTTLLKSEKEKYFNHYVKHVKYFPIRNTFIDSISTQFVDINGKQLFIKKNPPIFVHFHLKTKNIQKYNEMNYIRLDSEKTKMEPTNSNNNFWVHLKHPMELDENSEVALVNINFPNPIKNINNVLSQKHIKIILKTNENKFDEHHLEIPAGYYTSTSVFIQILNSILPEKIKTLIKFTLKNDKLKIESYYNNKIMCKFPIEYKNILGINTNVSSEMLKMEPNFIYILLQENSEHIATKPIDLMYEYPTIMLCHVNFVKHSIVGSSYFPILKLIPTETLSKEDYISVHFDHLEFIKVNVEYLKDLHFQLRDLKGNLIDFVDEKKIILNLVVKKRNF